MKRLTGLLAVLLLTSSCISGIFEKMGEEVDIEGNVIAHEMIVLGKQLEDPYSVDNMTKALASLYPTKADRVPMEPTDYYVRFLPEDDTEFEMLEKAGVRMMDHPMDYQILREGDYYHDPSIPDEEITWQYAVVPCSFRFPQDIRYELLEKCYIAENNPTKAEGVDWEAVEREAFRMTGNEDMLVPSTKAGSAYPEGRITIEDEDFKDSEEGVKGVMVSCNTFVKVGHAYTDEHGNYKMTKSFPTEPRYRLVFKNRHGFSIGMNLLLLPASASTLGKHPASGVDVRVTKASEGKLFTRCAVNNAAYDYVEKCTEDEKSMSRPPANLRIWLFQKSRSSSAVMLQQGAYVDETKLAELMGEYFKLLKVFLPDVTLGLKEAGSFAEIYALTIHELAHSSHFMQVGKSYWDRYINFIVKSFITSGFVTYGVGTEENHGYCEVGEMWAYYAQTMLYNERYPDSHRIFGTGYWFSPQIFLNLDARGLSRIRIFNSLTADVHDREILRKKLISLYPEMKSTINQAFERYN